MQLGPCMEETMRDESVSETDRRLEEYAKGAGVQGWHEAKAGAAQTVSNAASVR